MLAFYIGSRHGIWPESHKKTSTTLYIVCSHIIDWLLLAKLYNFDVAWWPLSATFCLFLMFICEKKKPLSDRNRHWKTRLDPIRKYSLQISVEQALLILILLLRSTYRNGDGQTGKQLIRILRKIDPNIFREDYLRLPCEFKWKSDRKPKCDIDFSVTRVNHFAKLRARDRWRL